MKHYLSLSLFLIVLTVGFSAYAQDNTDSHLKLWYSFNSYNKSSSWIADDSGNDFDAQLKNQATVSEHGGIDGVLDLGSSDGYLDLGAAFGNELLSHLESFTISTFVCIPEDVTITNNGNFVFSFGNSEQIATDANGCMFFSAKNMRYAICLTNWTTEQAVTTGLAMEKGKWKHLAITYDVESEVATIFENGEVIASSSNITLAPKDLGTPAYSFIGKSSYALNGDAYLKNTLIDEFRIYDVALSKNQITVLTASLVDMNAAWFELSINQFFDDLNFTDDPVINDDIILPTISGDILISWNSSLPEIISNTGVVVRPAKGTEQRVVELTATAVLEGIIVEKKFNFTVIPEYTNAESIVLDSDDITIKGSLDNLRSSLELPTVGFEGSAITWNSNMPELLANDGELIYMPEHGKGKILVTLTASIAKGNETKTRSFDIYVAEKEGMSAYLFAYFTGNTGNEEAIRFAISDDGYTYKALNNNQPIIDSKDISSTGGVRDPHILRGANGEEFYMVVTDMVSANGWNSNRAMVLMKSENLIDWQSSIVNIQNTYDGYDELHRVWAPQTIYDDELGKYMIYWSMQTGNGPDIIYYSYANSDFTALEDEPKILFENPNGGSTIDGDIVYKDGQYHLFFKTEGEGFGIKRAVSSTLTGNYKILDKYLQSTNNAVEGGCVFRMYDTDNWILMYDMYTSGAYQFTESTDLENFKVIDEKVSFDFSPRHGTIIPIDTDEAAALMKKWGSASDVYIKSSESEAIKMNNVIFNQDEKTIYLPVRYGTDVSDFDPELLAYAGCTITPEGAQNFSLGTIDYSVSINGLESKTYSVEVEVDNNPVLEGYYADPDIMYSYKNKKFYLYPTSDGFVGWSGYYFKTFSSENLVNWTDEGVILDLHNDVSWGTYNAWAPSIIEKKISDDQYKYYYYFVAAGNVGVAVADEPTGPFVDSGKKLADNIDPAVFCDQETGKDYLFWGNTRLYAAELNDDMVSINTTTKRTITPSDGTFREGIYVVKRKGIYYYFWSEDDTRSPNYQIRYGTSNQPIGTITIPSNNLILSKDDSKGIYGTGHNSVIQIPGTDEWYIVYHRFTRPGGIEMKGDSAGYFREVCIDKLIFNEDGSILKVQPTVQGIDPVRIEDVVSDIPIIKSSIKTSKLKSTEYYDLDGREKKSELERGFYIELRRYEDGTADSRKFWVNK